MRVFENATALGDGLARAVVDQANRAIAAHGRFAIALSGGETPKAAYELLGSRYAGDVRWDAVHVFFVDERFVPESDPRNNAGVARRAWLDRVSVPAAQVHAIPPAGGTPGECAAQYERLLRDTAATRSAGVLFDLTIMGMGPDGHTASLFPGEPTVQERERWVIAVTAPPAFDVAQRITLTLPALGRSRRMVFAAAGAKKREMLARVLAQAAVRGVPADGSHGSREPLMPAALARGIETTDWFVDRDAARAEP